MKIRTRLFLLFAILLAGFGLSAALLQRNQREEAGAIFASLKEERAGLLDRVLALTGQSLQSFANDYSLWDEMLQFVQTGDPAWAAVNIDPSLANFNAQAAWVVGLDGKVLYAAAQPGLAVQALTTDGAFLDRLRQGKIPHFFQESPAGLFEIRAAPVQPSDDIRRETPGRAWFIVARLWDQKHLSTLAEALQSRVTLGPANAADDAEAPQIHLTRPLSDWRGQPLQVLHVAYESRPLGHLLEGNRAESYMLYGFGLMAIAVVMLGISRWVLRPLAQLGVSLESGRSDAIGGLQARVDEFGHLARQVTQSFVQRDALRDSEARLRHEMDLRGRLARDLHDGIIQSIYAAGLGLESVRNLPTTEPASRQRLAACQQMLNDTLWQVRNFIESLEPEGAPAQSPAQSLATLAASIHSLQHIPITTDLDPTLAGRIDPNQELHLLQAARELLSNALRHSGARQMHLSLRALPDGRARMEVRDNGLGFDPAQRTGTGRGLANLAARTREFGAQLAIDSAPGNGTRVTIEFRPCLWTNPPMTEVQTISVLIVDDSELVRMGLKTLLNTPPDSADPGLHVIGEAATLASAVSEAARLRPDVVLLDIRLPDGSGLSACSQILADNPETRILVLTSVIDDNLVYDAMSKGAHGYLLKEIDAQGLRRSIVAVAAGKFILDPALTTRVLHLVRDGGIPSSEQDRLAILSIQERRVLALVAQGMTNKEIAEQMGLSDKTVKNYLGNVFGKLKIKRRAQAAVLYLENNERK